MISKYIIKQISELDDQDIIKNTITSFLELEEEVENRLVRGGDIIANFDSYLGKLAKDENVVRCCKADD